MPARVEGEGPADLLARFNELVGQYQNATMAVLFESETFVGDSPEEMLFQKDGERTRTDEVSLGEDLRLGATTIRGEDVPPFQGYCTWSNDGGADINVNCPRSDGRPPAIDDLLSELNTVAFDGYRDVLGVRTECFHINYENRESSEQLNTRLLPFGMLCFSVEGSPLIIESNVHPFSSGRLYVAKEIRELDPNWRTHIVEIGQVIAPGETKYFAVEELRLPDTPLTMQIVESLSD